MYIAHTQLNFSMDVAVELLLKISIWNYIEDEKKILLLTMKNLTIMIKYNFKGFSF